MFLASSTALLRPGTRLPEAPAGLFETLGNVGRLRIPLVSFDQEAIGQIRARIGVAVADIVKSHRNGIRTSRFNCRDARPHNDDYSR